MIGSRTGIFPSNYVQEVGAETAPAANDDPSLYYQSTPQSNNYAEDAQNQEEADIEVSEINTQPKSETVQDNFSRPMSTSSTTSVSHHTCKMLIQKKKLNSFRLLLRFTGYARFKER